MVKEGRRGGEDEAGRGGGRSRRKNERGGWGRWRRNIGERR